MVSQTTNNVLGTGTLIAHFTCMGLQITNNVLALVKLNELSCSAENFKEDTYFESNIMRRCFFLVHFNLKPMLQVMVFNNINERNFLF